MKNLPLLFFFFICVYSNVFGQSNYSEQFVSIRDLEKLGTMESKDMSAYLIKNKFKFDETENHFIRDNGDDFILITRTILPSHGTNINFGNIEEKRSLKMKNSLLTQGYTLVESTEDKDIYKKEANLVRINKDSMTFNMDLEINK